MAAHSTPVSLWIPDLLLEIASHLPARSDISHFSKCNRVSRELIMPLLLRNICIPIHKATSIAYVLGRHPHYARRCSLFSLEGTTRAPKLTSGQCKPLFVSLAAVLLTLADNAHVKSVWWCKEGILPATIPKYVWKALGKLSGSLEELRISTSYMYIDKNWRAICAPKYPQLRTLDIDLWIVGRGDCSPLQAMLNDLWQLEELHIHLEKTASRVDLSSYHPRLRTFTFVGERLPSSFLNRHPTIERLSIITTHGYSLGNRDLPQLKALNVDGMTILETPGLLSPNAQRPITHLRLYNIWDDNIPAVHQLIENTHATLRHLELGWSILVFIPHMAECKTLFQHLPQLEELRVSCHGAVPLCKGDIVELLLALRGSTSIRRLRLTHFRGYPLSQQFLSNIGAAPASLEYLTWENLHDLFTYRLESRGEKTVGIPAELPYIYSGKTILDFDNVNRLLFSTLPRAEV